MAKIAVYNREGKQTEEFDANDAVFSVSPIMALIHQVYVSLMANRRRPWAHAKDRSDVRGGGRKPWRQKGTGRARHGSIRSPIWTGGGATFGPLNVRNYTKKINKKMNQKALKMALSQKVQDNKLILVDDLKSTEGKTKELATLRNLLPGKGKSTLLLVTEQNDMLTRAAKNIPNMDIGRAMDLNMVDLMHHQYVVTTKDGIGALEKRFTK